MDSELAKKIATGFGGGIGRLGESCGAVTGAIMVIGLKHGMTEVSNKEAKETTNERVNEFVNKFKERNNTIICRDLLGHDLSTPEGMKNVHDKNLTNELCPGYVKDAAEILEQIL
jgi:C_GCAxxG_C_C family probable redox protein